MYKTKISITQKTASSLFIRRIYAKASLTHVTVQHIKKGSKLMASQNNALVEIALALAMVFFTIMVLAMVSMSVSSEHVKIDNRTHGKHIAGMDVHPSSPSSDTPSDADGVNHISADEIIIYFAGKFFDADLRQIPETEIQRKSPKFLAVDPKIPTEEAVNIRKKFISKSLAVTLLNEEWLKILKEKSR